MEANYFIILLWVLPYNDMNQPWAYMCCPSWTHLPPLSPSHPSGSSQCTSPEHPVSCTEPGLVISFTYDNERVTGRKARGFQTEEIDCKCQTFFSLLSGRRKRTSNIFFPSLYKVKRRFLLKYCVAIMTLGFTWS